MVKILSWNILQGGGRRTEDIITHIVAKKADIIALQEFRPGKYGDQICAALEQAGLRFQFVPEVDGHRNTMLIAARAGFEAGEFLPERETPCHLLEAFFPEESFGFDLTLLPVHFPQKKAQLPLFAALAEDTPSLLKEDALILGDLNCGIPFEDSDVKTFYATAKFQHLLELGWVDAWRSRHGQIREFTWVSPRTGNRFRYDHCLASPGADSRIETVIYDHAPRASRISDHSSLSVTLGGADQL